MTPRHVQLKTSPESHRASDVRRRLHPDHQPPTEAIGLRKPERAAWPFALLYAGPWLIAAGWSVWLLINVGFNTSALITAGCFWAALLIALVVVFIERIQEKK